MTKTRALLALLLVTSGAMLGGVSLSGYYEPRLPQGSPADASSTPSPVAPGALLAPQGRLRFVAASNEQPGEKPEAVRPKVLAKAPASAARPKAEVKERPEPRPKRQPVAAPWPWNVFGE
jgi:hypothetical protein